MYQRYYSHYLHIVSFEHGTKCVIHSVVFTGIELI